MPAARIVGVTTLLVAGVLALVRPATAASDAQDSRREPRASRGVSTLSLFARFDPRAWLDELFELASAGSTEARLVESAKKGPGGGDDERRRPHPKPR